MVEPIPRVAIVGGGFGGLSAAQALRRAKAQVTIIDRRNHHLFQPLLYQVATAGLSPANIAYPIRSIVSRNLNTTLLLEEVCSVDLDRRCVTTTQGDIKYDFLIVAAGADNSYFGHDEWSRYAPGLKSLEDAIDIRGRILLSFEMAEREHDAIARRKFSHSSWLEADPPGWNSPARSRKYRDMSSSAIFAASIRAKR